MQTSGKLIYTLRIGKQIYTDNGVGNTLILIEGREEISAPFCYSVLLGNDTPFDEASLTNSSAALDISRSCGWRESSPVWRPRDSTPPASRVSTGTSFALSRPS